MGLSIAKSHMGKYYHPTMTQQQSDLIAIIDFLDSMLYTDLTNVIVQFIGNGDSRFVFDDAFKGVVPNTRRTRCIEVNDDGRNIDFYGLLHDGEYLYTCCVSWSKNGVDAEVAGIGQNGEPTSKTERVVFNTTDATLNGNYEMVFGDRYNGQTKIGQQTKNKRFTVHVLDNNEMNAFIINDVEDIGAKLHALLPFRFQAHAKQCIRTTKK